MLASLFISALAIASTAHAAVTPAPAIPPQGTELGLDYKSTGRCIAEISGRLFRGATFASDDMTHNKCLDFCRNKGYPTIGLEYGRECFCSFQALPSSAVDSNKCSMRCAGQPDQNCGGPDSLVVFQRDTSSDPNFYPVQVPGKPGWARYTMGETNCVSDSPQNRKAGNLFTSDRMSWNLCVDHCASLKKDVAALEYGKECFCSTVAELTQKYYNAPNGFFIPDLFCSQACPGDGSQLCGGSNALSPLVFSGTFA